MIAVDAPEVDEVIARELGVDPAALTDDLGYQSIPEWDSLRHVGLMLALESELETEMTDELMLQLRSVGAIREFASSLGTSAVAPTPPPVPDVTVHRGLENVYFDRTRITRIDGEHGNLEYRGYSIHDLVERSSFEETTWLLLHGELPDAARLADFEGELHANRVLPPSIVELMRALRTAHPMEALRTGVSALGALSTDGSDETSDDSLRAGVRLIAQVPLLVATHHALRSGREPLESDPREGHAANFLRLLLGETPAPGAVRFVDKDMIVHADHDANASAFAARVVVGCRSNTYAAITAAIAAFAGSVHGGAAERVMELIDTVGEPHNAATYVRDRLANNQPVMGFGHRVYRTEDPRVRHLRAISRSLGEERGDTRGFEIVEAVVAAMEPYARHGIGPNVDLYSGLAYRLLGLPDDLAVPIFVASRTAGWVAQILEQRSQNVLIRPRLEYVGATSRAYPELAAR